ncbi:MAG TPA: ExeM/NucH family extracellular endonuclease [Marinobacter sp.]|nr:ExeM/NucH family extracellular endonuclease [Marinobacter sp.]
MITLPESIVIRLLCCLALVTPALAAAGSCGQPATAITEVQGAAVTSPLVGQAVTVEGVLTQDSRQAGGFSGFYLQQADTPVDPTRSSALFVYTRHKGGRLGQRLRVTGKVKEHYGLTELVAVNDVQVCGPGALPTPVEVSLPWTRAPESLENMRVRIHGPLQITDSYQLTRFGEVSLAPKDPIISTEFLAPGPAALRHAGQASLNTLILDDGHARRNPLSLNWLPAYNAAQPGSAASSLVAGTLVRGLTGVLDYRYGAWRLQPDRVPDLEPPSLPEPAPAKPTGSNLRIMTLNLNNLFNGDGRGQGFPTSRGAKTQAQYQRQLQRLSAGLSQAGADLLALSELENDGYGHHSTIAQLAASLGPQWRFVVPVNPTAQKDAIRNGLLYREDRVNMLGPAQFLSASGRPALTQRFVMKSGGLPFRLVSVHLKSKSCRNASGENAQQNDGQSCYNAVRVTQAKTLHQQLGQLDKNNTSAGTLITGDFNSYSKEQPISELAGAGYTSMVAHFHPCTPVRCEHYSYRFKGARGSLDHTLASARLKPRVLSARVWNINADQPRMADYRSHSSAQPWRSSDHNPLITDLKL